MEYKIVRGLTYFSLEKEVNRLLAEGWKPTGGIMVHESYYFQALVRKFA